jgi:hypothetical protein
MRRSTPASSPSSFSRCSIAHFQNDSWYVCEGGYCCKCGLRRIEDSRKSCTWRNRRWEGNDKNRGCFRAKYACKRLNKAGSDDGINVRYCSCPSASRMCIISLPSTDHVHLPTHSRSVSRGVAEAKTTSCSVTVTSCANAQGLKSCDLSPLLRVWISPLKQREKARSKPKATGLFQGTHHGATGRKLSASNSRNPIGHVIGLEAK